MKDEIPPRSRTISHSDKEGSDGSNQILVCHNDTKLNHVLYDTWRKYNY